MSKRKKVIIVGAGMAGLTAAAYLSKENIDVLLIEKNNRTGGLIHTFERDGFSFDTGPRAFINSGMVKPILNDLGIDWDVLENNISIAIEDEMVEINNLESINDYKNMLLKLYPEDAEDIETIIPVIYKLSKYTSVLYEFDNPYFVDYVSDKKVLFGTLLPWTFRLLKSLRQFDKYGMPMEDYLHSKINNQSLIDILTQFFFKSTPTYFALGYFHVYMDYFYPKHGTATLPALLHKNIIEQGGTIKLNTTIKSITPDQSTITDEDGNDYSYDHLIWAGDLKTFYHNTNCKDLPSKTMRKFNIQKEKVLEAKPAESVFISFLALDLPTSYFKERGGEHMFYSPSKEGLGQVNQKDKADILAKFDQTSKEDIKTWLHQYCERNTFEVSIPALRDASLAPEGKTGVMISCLFDYTIAKKIENAGWLSEFKQLMEDTIISLFTTSIYPNFDKHILFQTSSSPITINQVTGNANGAIVGWSFETKAPVANQLKKLAKSVATPIPNIYQASQWAYAPAGVPIAMLTGWQATQKIIKKIK